VAATGKVVVVIFDWMGQKSVPINEALREKIAVFQKGGGV
jgi:acyl-CoA thioesterase FadM